MKVWTYIDTETGNTQVFEYANGFDLGLQLGVAGYDVDVGADETVTIVRFPDGTTIDHVGGSGWDGVIR